MSRTLDRTLANAWTPELIAELETSLSANSGGANQAGSAASESSSATSSPPHPKTGTASTQPNSFTTLERCRANEEDDVVNALTRGEDARGALLVTEPGELEFARNALAQREKNGSGNLLGVRSLRGGKICFEFKPWSELQYLSSAFKPPTREEVAAEEEFLASLCEFHAQPHDRPVIAFRRDVTLEKIQRLIRVVDKGVGRMKFSTLAVASPSSGPGKSQNHPSQHQQTTQKSLAFTGSVSGCIVAFMLASAVSETHARRGLATGKRPLALTERNELVSWWDSLTSRQRLEACTLRVASLMGGEELVNHLENSPVGGGGVRLWTELRTALAEHVSQSLLQQQQQQHKRGEGEGEGKGGGSRADSKRRRKHHGRNGENGMGSAAKRPPTAPSGDVTTEETTGDSNINNNARDGEEVRNVEEEEEKDDERAIEEVASRLREQELMSERAVENNDVLAENGGGDEEKVRVAHDEREIDHHQSPTKNEAEENPRDTENADERKVEDSASEGSPISINNKKKEENTDEDSDELRALENETNVEASPAVVSPPISSQQIPDDDETTAAAPEIPPPTAPALTPASHDHVSDSSVSPPNASSSSSSSVDGTESPPALVTSPPQTRSQSRRHTPLAESQPHAESATRHATTNSPSSHVVVATATAASPAPGSPMTPTTPKTPPRSPFNSHNKRQSSNSSLVATAAAIATGTHHNPAVNGVTLAPTAPTYHRRTMQSLGENIEEMASALDMVAMRRQPWQLAVAERVKQLIYGVWPGAYCEVFGSIGSGLAAPCSDVDLVVRGVPHPNRVATLAQVLARQEWVQALQAVEHTTVPVIKFTTAAIPIAFGNRGNVIAVDITFENLAHHGLNTCSLVRQLVRRWAPLKPLVLVLKQFLVEKGLNDPYVGGLSSYGLVLMVTAVLKRRFPEGLSAPSPRTGTSGGGLAEINTANAEYAAVIGRTLIEFLEEYSTRDFVARGVALSLNGGVAAQRRGGGAKMPLDPLYIEDPVDPSNNVGRSCFGVYQVVAAFAEALAAVRHSDAVLRGEPIRANWSVLGRVFSTAHHADVVSLVTKVWCPPELPSRVPPPPHAVGMAPPPPPAPHLQPRKVLNTSASEPVPRLEVLSEDEEEARRQRTSGPASVGARLETSATGDFVVGNNNNNNNVASLPPPNIPPPSLDETRAWAIQAKQAMLSLAGRLSTGEVPVCPFCGTSHLHHHHALPGPLLPSNCALIALLSSCPT